MSLLLLRLLVGFWAMSSVSAFCILRSQRGSAVISSLSRRFERRQHRIIQSVLFSSSTEETDSKPSLATESARIRTPDGVTLDVRSIAAHTDVWLSHMRSRNPTAPAVNAVQAIAASAQQRTQWIQQRDRALQQRREWSDRVGQLMREAGDNEEVLAAAREASQAVSQEAEAADRELELLQTEMDQQLAILPNLLDDRVPEGRDDTDNEILYTWGDVDALPQRLEWPSDWKPLWHDDIATRLRGYWNEAAVQMSGARFIALAGPVAQLERAIGQWMLDLHTNTHGYTEVSVPLVVSRSTLEGTGQLPKFEEDLFAITSASHTCNGEDAFLIPTAEVPVTNLHRDQVLEEEDLPLSYVALTPCFRAEAGSYGRDTKGLIRTHQFYKVELVKITSATTSDDEHELLTTHAEACLKALELPYRKVRLCAGDIGFAARHCYDLEVWLPGAGEYREISSCSNTGDFQARRLALRYRPTPVAGKKGKLKPVLCHTINGSGLAVGRTLVAILENYQRSDGSVVIPEVLRPYMGGKEVLMPPPSSKK
jgi:seryl-tRNA synthetase